MVQDKDDIIDLTDRVADGSSQEEDQDIIELTQVAPGDGGDKNGQTSPDPVVLEDVEIGPEEELSLDSDSGNTAAATDIADVRGEEIEAALERLIEKKFSQTIETILFEVTEKVIQREIADIKASLQKDLDDIGRS